MGASTAGGRSRCTSTDTLCPTLRSGSLVWFCNSISCFVGISIGCFTGVSIGCFAGISIRCLVGISIGCLVGISIRCFGECSISSRPSTEAWPKWILAAACCPKRVAYTRVCSPGMGCPDEPPGTSGARTPPERATVDTASFSRVGVLCCVGVDSSRTPDVSAVRSVASAPAHPLLLLLSLCAAFCSHELATAAFPGCFLRSICSSGPLC